MSHRPRESTSSPRRIEAKAKQALALELRKQGQTLDVIAKSLGYSSPSAVSRAIESAMSRIVVFGVEALRTLENERYDSALSALWPDVERGDVEAIGAFIRLSARRCKLLGLDLPLKIAPSNLEGTGPYKPEPMTPDEAVNLYREAIERAVDDGR